MERVIKYCLVLVFGNRKLMTALRADVTFCFEHSKIVLKHIGFLSIWSRCIMKHEVHTAEVSSMISREGSFPDINR